MRVPNNVTGKFIDSVNEVEEGGETVAVEFGPDSTSQGEGADSLSGRLAEGSPVEIYIVSDQVGGLGEIRQIEGLAVSQIRWEDVVRSDCSESNRLGGLETIAVDVFFSLDGDIRDLHPGHFNDLGIFDISSFRIDDDCAESFLGYHSSPFRVGSISRDWIRWRARP